RFSDYGKSLTTDTYKIGADWAPVNDVRFRTSYQRAIRAANIIELFTAQGFSLFDMDEDPCGPARTATLAQCVATGVPAAQYGNPALDSPAGQYNVLQGGNPDLQPEESDTVTFGIVFTPSFWPGFFASVDYYDIQIDETISTFGPTNTIDACYVNNDARACGRIRRNPANGSLWIGSGNVVDTNINIGSLQTKGIDIQLGYNNLQIGRAGKLNLTLQATSVDELITEPGPGLDPYECAGFFTLSCGTPTPEWRHRFRVAWITPWRDISLALTWRHIGSVKFFGNTNPNRLDAKLDAKDYFDLTGSWQINDKADLRIGINNVLDTEPPLSGTVGTTGNGNTYPQTYDALGRFIFGNLTWKF
ncbi:MAG: TonB-dependent receptor, partial [Gammaproteobacteria bacterium]|nr:TonB-dependent receptor [Gammaproteobacteria bacterium]